MKDHVYKHIEITGTSMESIDAAIRCGLDRAAQTLDELRWFEVTQIRGSIDKGKIDHYQVTLKIGFTLKEEA